MKLNWPLLLIRQASHQTIGRRTESGLSEAKLSKMVHMDLFRLSCRSLKSFYLKKKVLKNMIFKNKLRLMFRLFCLSTEMIYFLTFMRILVVVRMVRIEYEY